MCSRNPGAWHIELSGDTTFLCLDAFWCKKVLDSHSCRSGISTGPIAAGWKSLPKQRETAEKGRESQACLLEISTQITKIGRKGRESQACLLEISTQTAGNSRKG